MPQPVERYGGQLLQPLCRCRLVLLPDPSIVPRQMSDEILISRSVSHEAAVRAGEQIAISLPAIA